MMGLLKDRRKIMWVFLNKTIFFNIINIRNMRNINIFTFLLILFFNFLRKICSIKLTLNFNYL